MLNIEKAKIPILAFSILALKRLHLRRLHDAQMGFRVAESHAAGFGQHNGVGVTHAGRLQV